MSFVLRVVLPDRPGTLGAVATALGEVGADILAMDVIERSPTWPWTTSWWRCPRGGSRTR